MADLVGDDFLRFFVCSHNRWNPYDPEIQRMPPQYWLFQYMFLNIEKRSEWKQLYEPQAELIGQLCNPRVYKTYYEYKKKAEAAKNAAKDNDGEIKISTDSGEYVATETEFHYDPTLGVVDKDGRVVIPKEQYENAMGINGIAISS